MKLGSNRWRCSYVNGGLLAVSFLVSISSGPAFSSGMPSLTTHVVARVCGKDVMTDEIHISLEDATLRCEQGKTDSARPTCDPTEIETTMRQAQRNMLMAAVRSVIFEDTLAELGITSDDAEVTKYWERRTAQIDADQLKVAWDRKVLISEAIEAVYESKEDASAVYDKLLSSEMSWPTWKMYMAIYANQDLRQHLALQAQGPAEGILDISGERISGARSLLLQEKLLGEVDRRLAHNNEEFRDYLKVASRTDASHDEIREAQDYLDRVRKGWWIQRNIEARILILDPRFEDVIYAFVPPESKPNDSQDRATLRNQSDS